MSRVIHFEVPADDTPRARRFYEQVLGWRFQQWDGPVEYWMATTGPGERPGIDGALMVRQAPGQGTVNNQWSGWGPKKRALALKLKRVWLTALLRAGTRGGRRGRP